MKNTLNIKSEAGVAAAIEANRLSEKYNKDFFDAKDLVAVMGIGLNNARQLLNSDTFPTMEIGNRKVVGIAAFVLWTFNNDINEIA